MSLEDDLDALVRQVDGLCAARDWDGLVSLRTTCLAAVERGHQHWPIASLIEYRLALRGPAELAAEQLVEGRGRFALGPLAEVAASTHTWDELARHLPDGPMRWVVAHERALRGDDLQALDAGEHLEVPLVLGGWEPRYALATYHDDRVEAPRPPLPDSLRTDPHRDLGAAADASSDEGADDAADALMEVVRGWTATSEATAAAVAVDGDAHGAIAALGHDAAVVVEVSGAEALAQLAWAGASGGAHGRRRGAAAGRSGAWWAAAALAGLDEDWPPHPDDLGEAIAELRWFAWEPGDPDIGWRLHLAVEDDLHGMSWALAVVDGTDPPA